MISCKQSTEWVVQKEHDKLSVKQNLQLLSHMAICRFCRFFAHQNSLINKALHKNESKNFSQVTATEKEELLLLVQNRIKQ